ncbi:MAG TPA: lipid-binding SYLF domain-containing protein [Blastocatellia bacterium]|nr:lipid-binding SYLF domain-containing protein [Blastocatellia bacterium]
MRKELVKSMILALCLTLVSSVAALAGDKGEKAKAAEESAKAAEAFREIMAAPDKAIPHEVLDAAECIAVFPNSKKGAFVVGVQKGKGVVSCRTGSGWSAPVFLDMEGGSFGPQIGGQSTDYVLLFMNQKGADRLLSNKFEIGGEASVAAGPVGRSASASTDWKLNAEILSYSRSKGAFIGAALKGVKISTDDSKMREVYGMDVTPQGVLRDNKYEAPADVRALPNALGQYSAAQATSKQP